MRSRHSRWSAPISQLVLEIRVSEPGKEEIVDSRRAESLPPGESQLAPRFLDDEGGRSPPREGRSELVVVLPAEAAAEEEAVEEGQLVLTEEGQGVEGLAERRGKRPGRVAGPGLAPVLPAETQRVPLGNRERAEHAALDARGVGLGDGR